MSRLTRWIVDAGRRPLAAPPRMASACALLVAGTLVHGSAFAAPPPRGADLFEPPVLEPTQAGGTIVDGLRSARPGDALSLAGDFGGTISAFEVFGQTSATDAFRATVKPVALNAHTAVLILPPGLPPASTYLVWPKGAAGYGAPFAVNRTEAWWVGPKAVRAGETVSIFGRNLTGGPQGRSFVFVRAAGGDGVGRSAEIKQANAFKIEVAAPDLAPGAYEFRVHNGGGGERGWSDPLPFEIERTPDPTALPVFDVRAFGASGDGVHDDGAAIEAALAAAGAAAPSTVLFPSGVYRSVRPLVAPSGVSWRGEGDTVSKLRFTELLQTLHAPAFIYSQGEKSRVSFERLSIEADGKLAGPDGGLISLGGAHFRFRSVKLSSWGGLTLRLAADDVSIENAEIVGAGNILMSSSQVFVSGTTFRMTNDGESAFASWGGEDIAMIGNRLVDADETRPDGHGIGRLFVAQPHLGSSRNLYFADNETRNSAPRDCAAVDCNKGEQIILEFGGATLRDAPVSIGRSSISFSGVDAADAAPGAEVIVAGGRGLGQRRRIVSSVDGALKLDRPWDVEPDRETGRFFVAKVAERAVVYRNRFQGRATYSAHDSNSTATLVWGLCFDVVVADNDISRMRHGVMVAATSGTAKGSVAAPFFTLVEGNRIREGHNGLYTGLTFGFDTDPKISGGVGNVFRRNQIHNMNNIGIAVDTWDTVGGDLSATIFDRNRLDEVRYGVVSGLKLIWSKDFFRPTPRSGTRLLQTVLHANRIAGLGAGSRGAAFRSDGFQDWNDIGGLWLRFPRGAHLPARLDLLRER